MIQASCTVPYRHKDCRVLYVMYCITQEAGSVACDQAQQRSSSPGSMSVMTSFRGLGADKPLVALTATCRLLVSPIAVEGQA
jgi:hypothetical protein